MQFPNIPADKAQHIIWGAVIGLVAAGFSGHREIGLAVGAGAGAVKEALDAGLNYIAARRGLPPSHDVDVWDFLATAAGAGFTFAAMSL